MRFQSFGRLLISTCLAFGGLEIQASKPMVDVPLAWKPTSTIQDFRLQPIDLNQLRGIRIAIAPFTSSCSDSALIGENREDEAHPKTVRTKADVPAFVTDQFNEVMKEMGLPLADKAGPANLQLKGEIINFKVIERNTYVGDIRIKLTLSKDSEIAWEGLATGQAKRFGRSYKLENYQEVLSDSLLEAIARVASSPAFLEGMTGRRSAAPSATMPDMGFQDLDKTIRENAQKVSPGNVFRLAVLPFIQTGSERYIDKGFGQFLTENIISTLGTVRPAVRLFERSRLDAVLKEQALSNNGMFSETEAKRLGELVPIDYVLTGTYTKLDRTITMNARFIDVVSGEVALSFASGMPMSPELESLFASK